MSTNDAELEWRIVVRRAAAGVGALCGLISLLNDAPAWVACVRGGAASFLIAALGRVAEAALRSSPPSGAAEERTDPSPAPPAATTTGASPRRGTDRRRAA